MECLGRGICSTARTNNANFEAHFEAGGEHDQPLIHLDFGSFAGLSFSSLLKGFSQSTCIKISGLFLEHFHEVFWEGMRNPVRSFRDSNIAWRVSMLIAFRKEISFHTLQRSKLSVVHYQLIDKE
jgi:hypothetical protein